MRTAVVTLNTYNDGLVSTAKDSQSAAARRWGAEYVILTNAKGYSDLPQSDKLLLPEHCKGFDQVVYVDRDVVIRSDCPSLFDSVSVDEVGAVLSEQDGHRFSDFIAQELYLLCKQAGVRLDIGTEYFNSGVLVFSPSLHREMFDLARALSLQADRSSWAIYVHGAISLALKLTNVKLQSLPSVFNRCGNDVCWDGWTPQMKAFIQHFCGGQPERDRKISETVWNIAPLPSMLPKPNIRSIEVPHESGYNACRLYHDGATLYIYRETEEYLACCWAENGKCDGSSPAYRLPLRSNIDPRVISFRDSFWLSTTFEAESVHRQRIELRELRILSDRTLQLSSPHCFEWIHGCHDYHMHVEKNWVPFVFEGDLYYVHWFIPHRILKVDLNHSRVTMVAETSWDPPTSWEKARFGSEPHLNAPPVLLRCGDYLSTFHTSKPGVSYYNGFYIFEGKPPFKVKAVSPLPVLTASHCRKVNSRNPWHGSGCIFPLTLEVDELRNQLKLVAGDNDDGIIEIEFVLSDILESLT